MHRTDGDNNINNRFTDNIPGTVLGANWLNAVQEEIVGVIEGAGMSLNSPSADTADQLLAAILCHIDEAIAAKTLADYPIGDIYVQYPVAESDDEAVAFPVAMRPATKYGGTWSELYDNENVFFRTKGTDGQLRVNGLSADQMQGIAVLTPQYHNVTEAPVVDTGNGGVIAGSGKVVFATTGTYNRTKYYGSIVSDGTNGTPRTGAVTEPRNRLFKVWIRTA